MNEIAMISIDKLRHHPQNPWKSIGDVTELAESIKAKGILQNLTVVQCPSALGEYWVVIGNRRLEAAKQAGVKELPCLISTMDEKEPNIIGYCWNTLTKTSIHDVEQNILVYDAQLSLF